MEKYEFYFTDTLYVLIFLCVECVSLLKYLNVIVLKVSTLLHLCYNDCSVFKFDEPFIRPSNLNWKLAALVCIDEEFH